MENFEITEGKTRDFELKGIGNISYEKWYSNKVEVQLADGSIYKQEPYGFWGTRHNWVKEGKPVFEGRMTFWGKIIINPVKEPHHAYTLKHKGWNGGYVLENYKGQEVAQIISNFTWKSFRANYTLTSIPGFTDTETGKLLILLMSYHYRAMQRSGASMGVVAAS
jgi:hypothetical protein